MPQLPPELWRLVFEFDPTYREHFGGVLEQINLLTTKRLASDYVDLPCQHYRRHFRFYQKGIWYTAKYTESEHNVFHVTLFNEQNGTFGQHLHRVN